MDSRRDVTPLERNRQADVREGWDPLRHRIAVPESVFVQAMGTVARERFGDELERLTSQTQRAIEEELCDPLYWTARPIYHARECPACAESSFWDGSPTP